MELALEMELSCKRHTTSVYNHKRERVDIEDERQELHHQDQLQSKVKEKMTALGSLLAVSRKVGRKSGIMIRTNNVLATLTSENKVRIAAHLIRSNTALGTLASENKVLTNLCLTTHTYYLQSYSLNPQRYSFNTRLLSK